MAVNTSKVVVGGIAAGVVITVIDFISNMFILGARMTADANAFKAGLGDDMAAMSGMAIAGYTIMNLVVGMLLIWTYAGIRPRFGPGPRTASYVALIFFTFGLILTSNYMVMGIMSQGLWLTYGAIWLVNLLVATYVGAMLYKEDNTAV